MAKQYDIVIKLLSIGDSGVGKTCLLCRFTDDTFCERYGATIGIDFKMKKTIIDGRDVRVQLWDTAGQERFETITRHYFHQAQGIFLVYDITNESSFVHLEKWMNITTECSEDNPVLMLLGNKADREEYREVTFDRAKSFSKKLKIPFYETSAKDATNIEEVILKYCGIATKHRYPSLLDSYRAKALEEMTRAVLAKNKKRYENVKLSRVDTEPFVSELLKHQDDSSCCFG